MDKQKSAEYIRRLRKEKNMTQKELAEKIYVTDKAVSKWERGLGSPDISILPLLADALGVTADEILHGGRDLRQDRAAAAAVSETGGDQSEHGESAVSTVRFLNKRHARILCLLPIAWACFFGAVAILYLVSSLLSGYPIMPVVFLSLIVPWFVFSAATGFIPLILCYAWHRVTGRK